ncbi:tripartite tricarboxylate transporter substrate-binding protein [Bordetella genomosp. 8]|uniref:tripartite tricarboxylate transporter substrate-binding protein n=1 Tax=Bordetella genomosp. 8 TaxID=1416806 RepID=UPI0012FE7AC7|nr:tripartite tricarboxylate transporter substrate-binding protein [Bordetella genomosp. 8]
MARLLGKRMGSEPGLYKQLPYDAARNYTYVAPVVDTPFVLLANKDAPYKTLTRLIAAAKAAPAFPPARLCYAYLSDGTGLERALQNLFHGAFSRRCLAYRGECFLHGQIHPADLVRGPVAIPLINKSYGRRRKSGR